MEAIGEESLGVVTKGTKVRKLKYFGPATICRHRSCVRNSGPIYNNVNHGFL